MRSFHIGDLVTLSSGRMVSPAGRRGLYAIVDYMSGRNHIMSDLFNEQFVPDAELCVEDIVRQFSWLARIKVPDSVHNEETGQVFLDMISMQYGAHHNVERLRSVVSDRNP